MTKKLSSFTPHAEKVFVTDLESGPQKTPGGILLTDDNMEQRGIRPRWCRVIKMGTATGVKVGDWVLVEHGRWTFGIDMVDDDGGDVRIWNIEYPKGVLLVSPTDPRTNRKTTS
jgi:co-chaperonin GroES (HSP10)